MTRNPKLETQNATIPQVLWQPVQASPGFSLAHSRSALVSFFFGPFLEADVPFAGVVEQGHAEAAGGLDEVEVGDDDLPGVGIQREMGGVAVPLRRIGQHGKALAVEAEDVGGALEGAEHKGNALVFQQVGGGFVAAADQVRGRPPRYPTGRGRNRRPWGRG